MASGGEKHLAALAALRATREFRRSARLLGPICDALAYCLDDSAALPADADDTEADVSDTEEDTPLIAAPPDTLDCMQSRKLAVVGAVSVALEPEEPAGPAPTRAERLAERERATRERLNSKGGAAEAAARVRRIMQNTSTSAAPTRAATATPETVEALRRVGRGGEPAAFAVNIHVHGEPSAGR